MSAIGNHNTIVFCSETKDIVRAWHMTQVVDNSPNARGSLKSSVTQRIRPNLLGSLGFCRRRTERTSCEVT